MYQWRVTKYNPSFRNNKGAYLADDWTSVSDIGKIFNGHRLELPEYIAVEDRYVSAGILFLKESGLSSLVVKELETYQEVEETVKKNGLDDLLLQVSDLHNEQRLFEQELKLVCRLNLRNILWCKLEESNKFFIHFGYDYYMYIASFYPCYQSIQSATEIGLFIEDMPSPYANV